MESFLYLILSVSFSLFLRWGTAIYSYSGAGKAPMYGDYEAQRHWMEITYNLPVDQWYENSTDNDLLYWGLDYPPLTAYHSYLLGAVANYINPSWVELHSSRGHESYAHKLFMRYSVVFADVFIYFSAIIVYSVWCTKPTSTNNKLMTAGLILSYPGLILIDHGHFQYNCISLGLFVWAVVLHSLDHELLGSVAFVLALNYKQMELYHAIPFFCYLLAGCFYGSQNRIWRLMKLAIFVLSTFAVVWSPFLCDIKSVMQVISRVFPIGRGLYEDKVASFWCTLSIFIKIRDLFTIEQLVKLCFGTTLLALLPSSIHLLFFPSIKGLKLALINSSLVFFLFSFHVHEKSILLVAVPVCLLLADKPLACLSFLAVSTFSMLPLLLKDGLLIPYMSLSCLFLLLVGLAWQYSAVTTTAKSAASTPSSLAEVRREKERREWDELVDALAAIAFWMSLLGMVALTAISVFVTPPSRLPDLWPVLVSAFACLHFVLFLFYFHWLQLLEGNNEVKVSSKHRAPKEHRKGKARTFGNKKKTQ